MDLTDTDSASDRAVVRAADECHREQAESSPQTQPDRQCTPEEWAAFWKLGQIKEIASPGFAYRANLAREEGLLAPILAGDSGAVARRVSELTAALSAQIHSEYRPIHTRNAMQGDGHYPDEGAELRGSTDRDQLP